MPEPTTVQPRYRIGLAGGRKRIALAALTVVLALGAGLVPYLLQRQETERQRRRAEANFLKAADAVERLLNRIGHERLKDLPHLESLRSELLEEALQFQLGLLAEHSDDPAVLFSVARAARMAADLQVQLGRTDEAEHTCRQALSIVDELVDRSPRELAYRRERAAVLDTLGLTLAKLERTSEAESAYRQAIDLHSFIVMEAPDSAEDRWRMAVCLDHLGVMMHHAGRWDEADHFFTRGRQLCLANPPSSPADPRVRRQLVAILGHFSLLLLDRGRRTDALQTLAHAIRVQKDLIHASPRTTAHQEVLVTLFLQQASALEATGQPDGAERILAEARDLAERLRAENPLVPRYHELAATVFHSLASIVRRDPGRAALARELLGIAIGIQEKLVAMSPAADYLSKLASACDTLANLLRAQGQFKEAEALYRKELSYQSRLVAEHPTELPYRFGHGQALHNLADLLRDRGQSGTALPLEREAIQDLRSAYQSNIRNPDYRTAMSYAYWTMCAIHLDLRDHFQTARTISDYLAIEPNGFEESIEATCFLCRCSRVCLDDPVMRPKERSSVARSYEDGAMRALRLAVRRGFREFKDLETDGAYEPLRARDDFRALIRELKAMTHDGAATSLTGVPAGAHERE
jgi:tetratricopeptide (TPR) repeat protein